MRGIALALLAVAAIAYSLTRELALIAGNRGDVAARRSSITLQNEARQARLRGASSDAASPTPSRSVAEVRRTPPSCSPTIPRLPIATSWTGRCRGRCARWLLRSKVRLPGPAECCRRLSPSCRCHPDGSWRRRPGILGARHLLRSARDRRTGRCARPMAYPARVLALELGAALAAVLMGAVAAEAETRTQPRPMHLDLPHRARGTRFPMMISGACHKQARRPLVGLQNYR